MQAGREPQQIDVRRPVPQVVAGVQVAIDRHSSEQRPVPCGRGVRICRRRSIMFEDQPQSEIDARRARDPEFRALHDQHRKLNKKCMDAELGVLPIDDVTLGRMKREKLLAKQRLLRMYETPLPTTSPRFDAPRRARNGVTRPSMAPPAPASRHRR